MRVQENQCDHSQVSDQSNEVNESEHDTEEAPQLGGTGQSKEDEPSHFRAVFHQCYLGTIRCLGATRNKGKSDPQNNKL